MEDPPFMDFRRHAPATARNREPILAVLADVLPDSGTVLEVASGTGEHAAWFANALAPRPWLPSDVAPAALASIRAWRAEAGLDTLLDPIELDATTSPWPVESTDLDPPVTAVVCINMIHIAPWAACLGLMAGAGRLLGPGGILYLYGPFQRHGRHTAPSNAAFDASLKAQDPAWGVRDLDHVAAAAEDHGFTLIRLVDMPANNLSAVFRRG